MKKFTNKTQYGKGSDHPKWNGGRSIRKDAYVDLYAPNHPMADKIGRVSEHRYIMSEILGRPLTSKEFVHHKNGDRHDNRPENLELTCCAEHNKKHHIGRKGTPEEGHKKSVWMKYIWLIRHITKKPFNGTLIAQRINDVVYPTI